PEPKRPPPFSFCVPQGAGIHARRLEPLPQKLGRWAASAAAPVAAAMAGPGPPDGGQGRPEPEAKARKGSKETLSPFHHHGRAAACPRAPAAPPPGHLRRGPGGDQQLTAAEVDADDADGHETPPITKTMCPPR